MTRSALWFGFVAFGSLLTCAGGCAKILGLEPAQLYEPGTGGGGMGGGGAGPTCTDGVRNADETGSDCGGSICPGCPDGEGCILGTDCQSKVCIGGTCIPATCTDHLQNGTETDIDCGGACEKCGPGQKCSVNQDCKSASCTNGTCDSTCMDSSKGGDETDVDCGGSKCPPCVDGQTCDTGLDCQSGFCQGAVCINDYLWSYRFGDSGISSAVGVVSDSGSNVILSGTITSKITFGSDTFTSMGGEDAVVVKLDQSGAPLWAKSFGDVSNQRVKAVTTDIASNTIVAGSLSGSVNFGGQNLQSAGNGDAFVAKFSPSGSHIWSNRFGDSQDQFVTAVAPSKTSQEIVAVGAFYGSINFGGTTGNLTSAGANDIFMVKFGQLGGAVWAQRFGDSNLQLPNALAIDGDNNIIVAGSFWGSVDFGGGPLIAASIGSSDIFVAKFDTNGAHLWSKRFGDMSGQRATGVAVTPLGDVVVIGEVSGVVDFGGGALLGGVDNDVFVAMFDQNGNHIWSKRFGDGNNQTGTGVTVSPLGDRIIATGNFLGSIDFGGGDLSSNGDADVFVAEFDTSGNLLWNKRFGDIQKQAGVGVTFDLDGYALLVGNFAGVVNFGGPDLTSMGFQDMFVVKLNLP